MARADGKRSRQDQASRLTEASEGVEQAALDRLAARFDADLASLQDPDAVHKVQRVFAAKGRLRHPPKAGETF